MSTLTLVFTVLVATIGLCCTLLLLAMLLVASRDDDRKDRELERVWCERRVHGRVRHMAGRR